MSTQSPLKVYPSEIVSFQPTQCWKRTSVKQSVAACAHHLHPYLFSPHHIGTPTAHSKTNASKKNGEGLSFQQQHPSTRNVIKNNKIFATLTSLLCCCFKCSNELSKLDNQWKSGRYEKCATKKVRATRLLRCSRWCFGPLFDNHLTFGSLPNKTSMTDHTCFTTLQTSTPRHFVKVSDSAIGTFSIIRSVNAVAKI